MNQEVYIDGGFVYKRSTYNDGSEVIEGGLGNPQKIVLTTEHLSYAVGETATITAKLFDYLDQPLTDAVDVTFSVGGQSSVVATVGGEATFPLSSDVADTFEVTASADMYNSGTVEVTFQ